MSETYTYIPSHASVTGQRPAGRFNTGTVSAVADYTEDELWGSIEGVLERTLWERSTPPWYPPTAGSPLADADVKLHDFPMTPIVHMSVVVGRDHLVHARYLIRELESTSVGGPSALLRAALETVAMGMWVVRSDDAETRMVRALRWHYLNLRELFRVQEADSWRVLDEIERETKTLANAHGIDPTNVTDSVSTVDVLTELDAAPDTGMSLVDMWRIASGFAHGKQWPYPLVSEKQDMETMSTGIVISRYLPSRPWETRFALEVVSILGGLVDRWQELSSMSQSADG